MIQNYKRPRTLFEAVELLQKPNCIPMGGGSSLIYSRQDDLTVVDLQSLGLTGMVDDGVIVNIGATTRLQELAEFGNLDEGLRKIVAKEKNFNLRNQSTIAGCLVTADGRSGLAAALLAADGQILVEPNSQIIKIEDWFTTPSLLKRSAIITSVAFSSQCKFYFEMVGRSPQDIPTVLLAGCSWPTGRVRIVLGGDGKRPVLAADKNVNENILPLIKKAGQQLFEKKNDPGFYQDCCIELATRFLSGLTGKAES
jgi:CO/xanthine dehydrogenase FAD-binding subunit